MLIIALKNDLTGNEEIGNYNVLVKANDEVLWKGRIDGHRRAEGWQALVYFLAEELYRLKLRKQNQDGEFS